jgi:hypothetical protein
MNKSDYFGPKKSLEKDEKTQKHKKCSILPSNESYMKDIGIPYLVSEKKNQPTIQCNIQTARNYDFLIL